MRLTVAQCKSAKVTSAPRAGLRRGRRSSSSPLSFSDKQQHIQQTKHQNPKVADGNLSSSKYDISPLTETGSAQTKRVAKREVPVECFDKLIHGARFRRQRSFDLNVTYKNARVLSRTSSCTTIGRKRVIGFDDLSGSPSSCFSSDTEECSPRKRTASPGGTPSSCLDRVLLPSLTSFEPGWCSTPRSSTPQTPSTPTPSQSFKISHDDEIIGGDSRLEDLPFDIVLRIVCCLQHDDLKPVSLVCKRLFQAVSVSWQYHFCFTTPRREKKGVRIELFPDGAKGGTTNGNESRWAFVRPPTPQAPRQSSRPADARFCDFIELCPLALPPPSHGGTKPLFLSSHRVLFNEDELCKAVEENSLSKTD